MDRFVCPLDFPPKPTTFAPPILFWCRVYLRRPFDDTAAIFLFQDDAFTGLEIAEPRWDTFREHVLPYASVDTPYGTARFSFQKTDGGWQIDPHRTYNHLFQTLRTPRSRGYQKFSSTPH